MLCAYRTLNFSLCACFRCFSRSLLVMSLFSVFRKLVSLAVSLCLLVERLAQTSFIISSRFSFVLFSLNLSIIGVKLKVLLLAHLFYFFDSFSVFFKTDHWQDPFLFKFSTSFLMLLFLQTLKFHFSNYRYKVDKPSPNSHYFLQLSFSLIHSNRFPKI